MAQFEKAIWAIKDINNTIFLASIRYGRKNCIQNFIECAPSFGVNATHWISFKRRGYTCVRIKITLDEKQ